MEFYINHNGTTKGPFNINELQKFGISANTLVSNPNGEGWIEAWKVGELKDAISNKPYTNTTQQYVVHYEQCPKTWLVESILSTLFCCLPFGVVGLIYSSKVENLYNIKEYEQARNASKTAKRWFLASLFSAILVWTLYVIFVIFFAAVGTGLGY